MFGDVIITFFSLALLTKPSEISSIDLNTPSDATNITSEIKKDGNQYVLNGTKWWTSGAMDPRCAFYIFMGKTDPDNLDKHKQQSMILVDKDAPGIKIKRHLPVFGFDDAPHGQGQFYP